jgi:tetratricopeptide (TPR) repeat protein
VSERDQGGRIELTPDQAFAQAVGLHNQGRLADAETLYNAVLKLVPAHAGALHHLGLLAFQTGNGAAALQLVDQALKAQPGYAEAWCNRGVILAASGNSKQAEQAYRKAIALSPDYADAWANLSGLLVDFGQPEDGLQAAEKAVALDPAQGALSGRKASACSAAAMAPAASPQSSRAVARLFHPSACAGSSATAFSAA